MEKKIVISSNNEELGNKAAHVPNHAFKPGNKYGKGRAKGSKSNVQMAIEEIGEVNAKAIMSKVAKMALDGDLQAAKLILDRVMPARKGKRIKLKFDQLDTIDDLMNANQKIFIMMAKAEISPEEAMMINGTFEYRRKLIEIRYVIQEINKLKERLGDI